ncbi:YdcF family protein [Streptomyces albicerus]|uniref:YdcF family protein n=1 Tax=Streptomyces albicerus TaxID=2569859 RepID=UPI00124B8375|nr:YdcF family protein [Streptomyces albicerus]
MLIYVLAAVSTLLFALGVLNDPRRFSNAVFLGLAVALLTIGLIGEAVKAAPGPVSELIRATLIVVLVAAVTLLACYLIGNGVRMVRKEGRRLANLLSLLAGTGILAIGALLLVAIGTGLRPLSIAAGITFVLVSYFAFLFVCFVGYGFLYGRIKVREPLDYVIVLGSGLLGGKRVPPLLASRLERGRAVWEGQATLHGRTPILITSGGQGPDEDLPESHAMAQYLVERGFPEDFIVREDKSRTTEENLRFSKAIMELSRPDYHCAVVTNNFHVFRSALVARATGVRGQVLGSPTSRYFLPSATLREFTAVVMSRKLLNAAACVLLAQQCWVTIW